MPEKQNSSFKKPWLVLFGLLVVVTVVATSYRTNTDYKQVVLNFIQKELKIPTAPTIINQKQVVVEEESAVISAVAKVSPAVVSVVTDQTSFNPFTGESDTATQGIGTGFIVESNGVILTNKHVVSDVNINYTVVLKDKTSYPVKKVYLDPSNDLAIVTIEAKDLPAVELGESNQLKVGQTVIAIGNALGRFDNTVTKGVVSALGRGITASSGSPFDPSTETLEDVIQTDASLNPGNSGGPLINLSGQVIGINSAVSGGAQGIGFAIPINTAKPVLTSFEKTGKIVRPYLGISYQLVTADLATFSRLPAGALIRQVIAKSPAEEAGLKKGDVILSFGGEKITETVTLSQLVLKHQVEESVQIVIDRSGSQQTITATLKETPYKVSLTTQW